MIENFSNTKIFDPLSDKMHSKVTFLQYPIKYPHCGYGLFETFDFSQNLTVLFNDLDRKKEHLKSDSINCLSQ